MADQPPVILESNVSLSQSVIWGLQRDFYVQRGLKAWTDDRVPNFITSNPFIADIYARIVLAYFRDCRSAVSSTGLLRILDLGAGAGKFAFLFLRHLEPLLKGQGSDLNCIRYCMTDCSEDLIRSWRENSYLAEFVHSGVLQFELLEAGNPGASEFLRLKGPLVVIANYVFDSLPQDAFLLRDGKLLEALVTTTAPAQSSDENKSPTLRSLQLSFNNVEANPNRYPEPSWNQILELYQTKLSTATIPFPCAALQLLEEITQLTDGPIMLLAADKGFVNENNLSLCHGLPDLVFHADNCFSQIVNFDAIGKYFQITGGAMLEPDRNSGDLNICCFLRGRPENQFESTRAEFGEAQKSIGPDDVFTLLGWLNAHMEEMSVAQILSTLRLTHWDSIAFLRLFPILGRQIRTVTIERNDLRTAVMRVWANHFPVQASDNEIAFDCGVILLKLGFFDDALAMFTASQKMLGPSAPTSYNLGLCSLGLGRSSEALAFMTDACNLDAHFDPARTMRSKLEGQNVQR